MNNICFIFLLLVSHITLGQQSIGVNFGLPQYTWHGGIAEMGSIQSESVGVYIVELEYLRPLKNTLLMGIDVGVHKISNTIRAADKYASHTEGFEPLYNFGISPKLLYHLDFGESGFGGFLSLGPSFRWINAKDREFDQSDFRITGQRVIDSDQNATFQPIEQNPYKGKETVRNFSAVIRPELGLSFKASGYSKFLIRFQYGIRMFSPLISRSFGSFELEGKQTPFRHILHSDFSSLQVGYQFLFTR